MPMITYQTVAGVLSEEQKHALSQSLTNAALSVLGEAFKPNVWVVIDEAPEGNFYIGGRALSAQKMRQHLNPPATEAETASC